MQYSGLNGDADVIGLPRLHLEIKRVERLNIYDAMNQSKRDARDNELPVVMHRKNRCEWLVTAPLDVFMQLYQECSPSLRSSPDVEAMRELKEEEYRDFSRKYVG